MTSIFQFKSLHFTSFASFSLSSGDLLPCLHDHFMTTNHILPLSFRLITEILKKISMDCVAIAFDKLSNWMPLSELSERKETVQPTMEEDDDDCIALE